MRRLRAPSTWREGRLWKGYFIAAILLGVAYFALGGVSEVRAVIYLLFVVSASGAILVGVRRYRPDPLWHWLLFAGGLGLWAVGDAYWQAYTWILGRQAPYPSIADIAYLGGYPAIVAGVLILVRGWGRPRIGNLLDTAIVAVAAGMFSMLFLLAPLLAPTQPLFAKLIAVAFPVMDFVMFVALTQLLFRRRVMSFALRAITIGTVALLLADAAYSRLGLEGAYTDGMSIDAGWLICYSLWGVAALHPSMAAARSQAEQPVGLSVWRVGALLLALLAAPIVLIVRYAQGTSAEAGEIAVVIVATMILVAVRIWLLQRESTSAYTTLARTNERLSLSQGVTHVNSWDMNLATGRLVASDELATMILGSSSTAVVTLANWVAFIHPDDRERVRANFERARREGGDFEHEYRFRTPNGAEGWLLSRGRVFLEDARAVGVAVDITQRHLMDEQLKRSEEGMRLAQELGGVGSWDANLETGLTTWSANLRRIAGVGEDVIASRESFIQLVHPEDRSRFEAAMVDAVGEGGPVELEYRLVRPSDGEVRWMLIRGNALAGPNGRSIRFLGVVVDITERHLAEEHRTKLEHQLRHAHKLEAVGRLAGGVAHDFNNILLAIRGNGELAVEALKHGRNAVVEVEEMVEAADRAAGLTKQLLAFSRRQVLQAEVLDLNEVVEDMDKLLRRMIGGDVELHSVLTDEPVRVSADRSQIEQVLANLAVNARDAMAEGGLLTLEVKTTEIRSEHEIDLAPGSYAMLSVSDTGAGMDPETVAKIFEPFFTTKDEGTGFGLSTVHGIVVQSGGSIWVYSEVGHGTTFKIFLPLAEQTQALESKLSEQAEGTTASTGETVLLVEDDSHVRRIVFNILARSGYRVLSAGGGEEALRLAEANRGTIHLLLSDLVMPGTSGRELAEKIQALQPGISILYMSGYTDDAVIRRGVLEAGMAFIQKPFGAADLGRRVRELLDAQDDQTEAA